MLSETQQLFSDTCTQKRAYMSDAREPFVYLKGSVVEEMPQVHTTGSKPVN